MATLRRADRDDQDLTPDLIHALVSEIARHRAG